MRLSIFLPMYNEAKILERSIIAVRKTISRLKKSFEIIVVDDSSTDSSPEIMRRLTKRFSNVRYLRYENGPSRRENLALAFTKATGDIILFSDTDLAADISAITKLVGAVERGYDIAIGCRYMKNSNTRRKVGRRIISFFYNLAIQLCFGSRIKDHNCGFKAFRRDVALRLAKEAGYDHSFTRGWFWDAEMLIRAQKEGYRILEMPVKWIEAEKSTFNIRREMRIIHYMFRLRKDSFEKRRRTEGKSVASDEQ